MWETQVPTETGNKNNYPSHLYREDCVSDSKLVIHISKTRKKETPCLAHLKKRAICHFPWTDAPWRQGLCCFIGLTVLCQSIPRAWVCRNILTACLICVYIKYFKGSSSCPHFLVVILMHKKKANCISALVPEWLVQNFQLLLHYCVCNCEKQTTNTKRTPVDFRQLNKCIFSVIEESVPSLQITIKCFEHLHIDSLG